MSVGTPITPMRLSNEVLGRLDELAADLRLNRTSTVRFVIDYMYERREKIGLRRIALAVKSIEDEDRAAARKKRAKVK